MLKFVHIVLQLMFVETIIICLYRNPFNQNGKNSVSFYFRERNIFIISCRHSYDKLPTLIVLNTQTYASLEITCVAE